MRLFLLPALGALLLILSGCRGSSENRVVVYCALDREFAEAILDDFSRETGIEVVTRWDTEANKSVGLYQDLLREAASPRCDVHWNNEIVATLRLQKQGILEPYDSLAAASFPEHFRAADRTWTAFAARARVFIVNTNKIPDPENRPRSLLDMTAAKWRGQFAMARPFFGTTATQAACLFQVLGDEPAADFFRQVKANDAVLLPGNKQVAVAVGKGQLAFGLTDTDDAIAETDAGNPVTIVFPDQEQRPDNKLGVLFIPNTVAIVKGSPNPQGARKLVDYLLRPEVEAKLAQSSSRQIPLNPQVKTNLPPEIRTPSEVKVLPVDFGKAAERWEQTQRFLAEEFKR